MSKKIKILIATHKPAEFPEGKYYVPIHVGREIAMEKTKDGTINKKDLEFLIKNTIGDNTGDNISSKNRYYNECSALYWAWKNYKELGDPDYIGLMHYRRHFVFNDEYFEQQTQKTDNYSKGLCVINEKCLDKKYLNNIGLNDSNIENVCDNYDAIVSYKTRLSLAYGKPETLRTDYVNIIKGMKAEDFDLMVKIIKDKYPQISSELDEYINGDAKYLYQMFIMRKDLFFEYCEFLFGILFEIEKQRNFDSYTINGKRTLGYLAEIMLSIFFILKRHENLKIKNVGITFITNTKKINEFLKWAFSIKNSNDKRHKIITVLGIKIKFRRKR